MGRWLRHDTQNDSPTYKPFRPSHLVFWVIVGLTIWGYAALEVKYGGLMDGPKITVGGPEHPR
jgi:hypothetical protein